MKRKGEEFARENAEKMKDVISMAKEKGLKVFVMARERASYGFIVTKRDNVIEFCKELGGYSFYLKYVPSKENGQGCCCEDGPAPFLTPEVFEEMENAGLNFAYKLKARLYISSDCFFNSYWDKENLVEV